MGTSLIAPRALVALADVAEAKHVKNAREPSRMGLVVTGGTIGSRVIDGLVEATDAAHADTGLFDSAWKKRMALDLKVAFPLRALSENLRPRDWLTIAESVRGLVDDENVSGVVVLHGTDTAAYSSAALSFLLADIDVPVVVTGSSLPPNQPGSDAPTNVADAFTAASNLGEGTYLSFSGLPGQPSWIHLGTSVRKVRASGQAFYSINRDPVAQVSDGVLRFIRPRLKPPSAFKPHQAIDEKVISFRVHPGLDLSILAAAAISSGIRGVVVELYASGTGPNHGGGPYSLTEFVERCAIEGILVVATLHEAPEYPGNTYESTVAIRQAGALLIQDMITETATVKLMWALASSSDLSKVSELMVLPIAGETNGIT